MISHHRLAEVAGTLAEPSRAAMLALLLDGSSRPAGELAARAGVTAATASGHLGMLVRAGLLRVEPRGRHRYFRLAGRHVAEVIETLASVLPPLASERDSPGRASLRRARLCYDHLAGRFAVSLLDAMVQKRWLRPPIEAFAPTALGERALARIGIDTGKLHGLRRPMLRVCLDWTERREHLAGALGAAIASCALEREWLARVRGTRALRVTDTGAKALRELLGMRDPREG